MKRILLIFFYFFSVTLVLGQSSSSSSKDTKAWIIGKLKANFTGTIRKNNCTVVETWFNDDEKTLTIKYSDGLTPGIFSTTIYLTQIGDIKTDHYKYPAEVDNVDLIWGGTGVFTKSYRSNEKLQSESVNEQEFSFNLRSDLEGNLGAQMKNALLDMKKYYASATK